MEDAVTRRGVVRLLHLLQTGELASDAGLLVVDGAAREHEMVVRDRSLTRIDRVAAADLVEGMNRERRRSVRGREEIRIHAQGRAGLKVRRLQILVDAVRPDDLLGRRQAARGVFVRPVNSRSGLDGPAELA